MRTLKFIVKNQTIIQDPECDFSGLVPGSEGYLKAQFKFSKEWDNCVKVISFWSPMGKEYDPQLLDEHSTCIIPAEALKKREFLIKVVGKGLNNLYLQTNKVTVRQNGGN